MIRKLALGLFGLSALGMTLSLFGAEGAKQPAQVTTTERVNFAPGGTIRFINSFGDLNVEGWDQPAVEMTLIKSVQNPYQPPKNAAEELERVRFSTEHSSANELAISTTIPSRSFFRHPLGGRGDVTVRYDMRVPRDSHLIIHHGGGNILVDNVTGGVEATNRDGDIMLMIPGAGTYWIDAKSKFGTVSSDFEGATSLARYRLGERYASGNSSSPRRIYLRVGFGGITIKAVPKEAEPPVPENAK